jgi:hypothetical protein
MATNHTTFEPVAQNCRRDMRERGRRDEERPFRSKQGTGNKQKTT